MLDRREYRTYNGVKKDDIFQRVCEFWSQNGFYVAQISPWHIQGKSYYSKIGLKREFNIYFTEDEGITSIDLNFNASISDEGLVGGVAAAVIFWPVAVVGGAISYSEYENDANQLLTSFWNHVNTIAQTQGQATEPGKKPMPPPPEDIETKFCGGCGALLPENWKACPYCGRAS